MNTRQFSFRVGAALTALVFLASSCGGGDPGGGEPFADPGAAPRGAEPPVDLATEVEALRAEVPTLLPSAEFGTIPGSAGVDGRGNASYSMGIDVAPGPNGLQPGLSLSYSSAGRNREVGLGFSLGGIPSLTRCAHSISDDGFVGGIEFDDDDALCFNGQRMVLISGVYGQEGSEYRTVRDPRSKIVLESGTIADRLSEWAVFEPSGQILRFGGVDSAISADGEPFSWLIRRSEDRFQNAIDYEWEVDGGLGLGTPDYRIETISYGSASVQFNYETRTSDEMHGYYAGVPYARTKRLDEIVVRGLDGSVLHTYDLDYEVHPQTHQSVLTTVQKCDGASPTPRCLPPTTFEWSEVEPGGYISDCDAISEEAYDENGNFVEPSEDDLAVLAPGRSVVLDAFGDLRHEVLLWDATDDTASPRLWAKGVPGLLSFDWELFQTALVPPTSALPTEPNLEQPEIYAPSWSPMATNFHGRAASDVLFPHYWNEPGLAPVSSSDPSLDYWGVPFATDFFILSNPLYDTGTGLVDYASTPLEDGEGASGGKIYTAVPLDHNGDGLTDLWLCRGDGFKTGRWVLGLNEGLGTPPFTYDWTTTNIQCSVHDELLTLSLHGDSRTSLLTVPAYDSILTAADFSGDYGAYLTSPSLQPIPDAERSEYFEVSLDDDALVTTGLPRAYFESWHDKNCHNGVADAELGTPVYSAGLGGGRVVDINGDGYSDVLRAELQTGDGFDNITAIKHGIDATAFGSDPLLCNPTQDQDLVIRAYINTGNGFEPGAVLHTFPGLAHVNYWINWRAAVAFDHNSDGLTDFLLPGLGTGSSEDALMASEADGDYHVGGDPVLPEHVPGYGAQTEDWTLLFQTTSRAFPVDDGQHIWFIGLDGPDGGGLCESGSIAQQSGVSAANGRVTLEAITNGMGARQEFRYRLGPAGEVSGPRPAGRIRKQDTVVRELRVQAGPGPGGDDPPMVVTQYEYEDPHYDDHGRGLVGYGQVREISPWATTTRSYNFAYHVGIADYPFVGRPERVETVSYNEAEFGGLQRVVSCEDVDDVSTPEAFDGWALVRPYQEQTWFSYPANVHNYTFSVIDNDRDREDGCDDASSFIQDSTTETEMNEWGLMTSRTFTTGDGLAWNPGNDVTSTTFSEWVFDEDEWFFAPQRTQSQSCVDGVCETRRSRRVFDPATHALMHAYREPDATDDTYLHTSFGYNARGNLETVTVEGFGGADARTTTTQWDPAGVVALESTNAMGHTSYVVSDPRSGVAWASVEPNGVTQRTVFDGFFRPVVRQRLDGPSGNLDGAVSTTLYGPGDPALGAVFELSEQVLGQNTRTQIGPTGKVLQVTYKGVVPSEVFPVPSQGPQAGDIYFRNEYDGWGRLDRTSHNTFVGNDPAYWTEVEYDESSRKRRTVVVDASGVELPETEQRWDVTLSASVPWSGTMTRESFYTDEEGYQQSTVTDQKGRVVLATDALGTATCYTYGPFGRLDSVQRNCGPSASGPQPSTTYTYDVLGRTLTETDPAFGTRTIDYTQFGEIEASIDAKAQVTFFQYDDLGRKIGEISPEGTSSWSYDVTRLGLLDGSKGPDSIERGYQYDSFNRVVRETTRLPAFGKQSSGEEVDVQYVYDGWNRVASIEFEPGIGIDFDYDAVGYHRATFFHSKDGQSLVWGWEHSDENTSLMTESFGENDPEKRTRTTRYYDPATGRLEASTTAIQGTNVQAFSFGWTPAGDLDYRLDSINGQAEEFEHDELHRLTESRVAGQTRTYAYDVLGNFTEKDGVGTYHYDADGARLLYTTNGVTSTTYAHDANGAVEGFGTTGIAWTSFGKVREISTALMKRQMYYDADGARVIREAGDEITVTAHGLYERRYDSKGNLQEARFKATNAAGAVVGEFRFAYDPSPAVGFPGTWKQTSTRFIHDDHLGSAGLITDENGTKVDIMAYDPWGRARDATDWNAYLSDSATDDLPIGFTGHQAELDGGLINMGGRMYDPRLGRFMSVDPVVAGATDTAAWNSYAYVKNRPLSLTDPTGFEPEGEGDPNSGWAQGRTWSEEHQTWCDYINDEGDCGRVLNVSSQSEVSLGAAGGPIGMAYWGGGSGSGVGMRNQNAVDFLGDPKFIASPEAMHEEIKAIEAMGGQCSVQGGRAACKLPPNTEAEIQKAMAGAFALMTGLNVVGTGVGAVTPLGDGVDIADAVADGDPQAVAEAIGWAVVGLIPGGKGAKNAKKAADVLDAAGDAAKVADVIKDTKKAAKAGDGSVIFHKYTGTDVGPTGRHVTVEIRDASGKSLGEFHQTGIKNPTLQKADDFVKRTPVASTRPRAISDPHAAAAYGSSGATAGKRMVQGSVDCVTGACAIGNAGGAVGKPFKPASVRGQLGM